MESRASSQALILEELKPTAPLTKEQILLANLTFDLNYLRNQLSVIFTDEGMYPVIQALAKTGLLKDIIELENGNLITELMGLFHPRAFTLLIMQTYLHIETLNPKLEAFCKSYFQTAKDPISNIDYGFRYIAQTNPKGSPLLLNNLLHSPTILQSLRLTKTTLDAFLETIPRIDIDVHRTAQSLSSFLIAANKILHQSDVDTHEAKSVNTELPCHPLLLSTYVRKKLLNDGSISWHYLGEFIASLSVEGIRGLLDLDLIRKPVDTERDILRKMTDKNKRCALFESYICDNRVREKMLKSENAPSLQMIRSAICSAFVFGKLDDTAANKCYGELLLYVSQNKGKHVFEAGQALYMLTKNPVDVDGLRTLQQSIPIGKWSNQVGTYLKTYLDSVAPSKAGQDVPMLEIKHTSLQ